MLGIAFGEIVFEPVAGGNTADQLPLGVPELVLRCRPLL
jgi:hypothetical protein